MGDGPDNAQLAGKQAHGWSHFSANYGPGTCRAPAGWRVLGAAGGAGRRPGRGGRRSRDGVGPPGGRGRWRAAGRLPRGGAGPAAFRAAVAGAGSARLRAPVARGRAPAAPRALYQACTGAGCLAKVPDRQRRCAIEDLPALRLRQASMACFGSGVTSDDGLAWPARAAARRRLARSATGSARTRPASRSGPATHRAHRPRPAFERFVARA